MIANLTFDLSDNDDWKEHEMMLRSKQIYCALMEFDNKLRELWKYSQDEKIEVEEIRNLFYRVLDFHNIELDL